MLQRQTHCHMPSFALLVELDTKLSQVMTQDQASHLRVEGALKPFYLASLTSGTQSAARRVTLAEARRKVRAPNPTQHSPESPRQTRPTPSRQAYECRHTTLGDRLPTEEFMSMSVLGNYRKLRTFSGSLTDPFDIWVDQAEAQLEEWAAAGISEIEKRRRISEVLRPPASTNC